MNPTPVTTEAPPTQALCSLCHEDNRILAGEMQSAFGLGFLSLSHSIRLGAPALMI